MAWMAMVTSRKSASFSRRNRTAERRGGSLSPPEASSSSVCRRTLQRERCAGASGGLTTATRGAVAVGSGLAVTTVAGGIRPWTTRATASIAYDQARGSSRVWSDGRRVGEVMSEHF